MEFQLPPQWWLVLEADNQKCVLSGRLTARHPLQLIREMILLYAGHIGGGSGDIVLAHAALLYEPARVFFFFFKQQRELLHASALNQRQLYNQQAKRLSACHIFGRFIFLK